MSEHRTAGFPGGTPADDRPPTIDSLLHDDQAPQRAPRGQGRPGVRAAAIGGGVLAVLAVAYLALFLYAGDRLPRDTTVAVTGQSPVPVGGLTVAEAEQRVRQEVVPVLDAPVTVTAAGASAELVPSEAGLTTDVAATVAAAGGGSADPVRLVRALFSGSLVSPVLVADTQQATEALAPLAERLARAPKDGAVSFVDGEVQVSEAVEGRALDVPAAAAALEAAWRSGQPAVETRVVTSAPTIDAADVTTAVERLARPAMSGPVQLAAGGRVAELSPSQLAELLSLRADATGTYTLGLAEDRLEAVTADAVRELGDPARDARVRIVSGRPQVVPAVTGRTVSVEAIGAGLVKAATAQGAGRTIALKVSTAQPEITTREAAGLGVKEVVGEFTTNYPHADYRNVNIGRAAELMNNTFLAPGETFSLNDVVGERSRANGFTEGFVINGGRLREDLGGGVSQVATTTFNAMWFAGLERVEHHPHAFYISRYPVGREATVWFGALDLRFRNDTPYGVVVQASVDRSSPGSSGALTVRMWSTQHRTIESWTGEPRAFEQPKTIYDDKDGCVDQTGVRGFTVDYGRTIGEAGKAAREETYTWRYKPEDTIFCRADPNA